jgi:hypothetical protein
MPLVAYFSRRSLVDLHLAFGRAMTCAAACNGRVGPWHRCGMATDPAVSVPNPLQRCDAEVLIGILAILEGSIWGGSLDAWTISKVAERFVQHGLLAAGHDEDDLRQAIGDMNQRLRYAVGEYDSPPPSVPLPP